MSRREWRQQVLLTALLTFTVAGALLVITAAYHLPDSPRARFGTATQLIRYSAGPAELSQLVAQARDEFGTIDVIARRTAPMPGLTRTVEVRAQDPDGPYGGPMLRLLSGRYPTGAGEVAVTDEVATLLGLRTGGRLALDGHTWAVAGMVENPEDLDAEFVLVPPAFADPPQSVTILTAASPQRPDAFGGAVEHRERDQRAGVAAIVFGLVTLGMLLVGLVAVAAFVAVAQRRRRQFGLLAATGATERQVRLVLLAGGAVTGAVAAALGTGLAVPLWIVVIPRVEAATAHRIDRFDVPWWLVGGCLLLAVLTPVGAAWWPARAAARIPVTQALSMRPPRPRPAHRSALLAVPFLAAGAVLLRLSRGDHDQLIVLGLVAVVVGLALLGPLAVRVAGAAGPRLAVAPRLALRDLVRQQARSGAALAAISLALAVPAFLVIESAANPPPEPPTLSDRQLMIRVGQADASLIPDRTPEQVAALEAAVRDFATSLGTNELIGLDVAMDPRGQPQPGPDGGPGGRMPVITGALVRDGENRIRGIHSQEPSLYIASPDLLRFLGVDTAALRPDTDVLTAAGTTELVFLPEAEQVLRSGEFRFVVTAPMPRPAYSSLPETLLNPATVQRRGWTAVRGGWLIEADQPLTTAQIARARTMAVDNGLSVEAYDPPGDLLQLRVSAIAGGAVLALGVLAMTVGLIRGEAARDLRTLAATGATRRIRRTLAATTAGALALLGAILGTAVAYLSLAALHDDDIGRLTRVPVVDLAVIVAGVPLAAAVAAWLLAGREPGNLGRTRMD
jgi:putative ABC transport system permease protein